MVGRIVAFDDINLHDIGVVESVTKENLSIELIDYVRAEAPNVYKKFKRNSKEINVTVRIIKKYVDYPRLEKEMDKIIISLHTKGMQWLNANGLHCEAVLVKANHKVFINSGELNLTFINYNGLFFSEEKTVNIGSKINLGLITGEEKIKIILNPTNITGKLKYRDKHIEYRNVIQGLEITIDLNRKTIKQLGKHVAITMESSFFVLENNTDVITGTNLSGKIKYREVVAL